MGYVKGNDGIPRTVKNPLEGSVGDISLDKITANTVLTTGNISAGGNIVAAGVVTAAGSITSSSNITGGNLLTGGVVTAAGNITGGNILTAGQISTTGNLIATNVITGNILTDGYRYANGVAVSFGGSSTTTLPAGNITYSETYPGDWPIVVTNVQAGLDTLANVVADIETGSGFNFAGPFSNDSAANAGGVSIGQVYFNNSGGLVVRQT